MTSYGLRCRTCGAPYAPETGALDDDGEPAAVSLFCSIHCEHYFGLARASGGSTAPHAA